ncbi:hypothetical protein [uncultured Caulobacter sp.]|uniref:hypothetical protein n=1 Tax=uncultured Caulobacter sp. TaxID=158749 RepID=UPI00263A2D60|nr:hypothetical protein [uncultured Caulobacter sp.]
MTDDVKALRDDLAFLRALAEDGRSAPLTGGSILAAAGAIFGLASLGQWLVLTERVAVSPVWLPALWLSAIVLHTILTVAIKRRIGARTTPAGARVNRDAWTGVAIGCVALFAALGLASWRAQTWVLIGFTPTIVLVLYGAAWWVSASVTKIAWIRAVALGAFASAVALAMLATSPLIWLAYAAALFLLAFLPGLALMRRAAAGT